MTMFLYQKCFYEQFVDYPCPARGRVSLNNPTCSITVRVIPIYQYMYNCEGRMPGFRAPDILGTWARMNEILLKEGGNAEIKK